MVPGLRDNMDELVERLGRLVRVLEENEFDGTDTEIDVTRTVNVDEPEDRNTSGYFSTGPDRLAVTDTENFTRLDFGFIARTINIRTTDDLVVAFRKPTSTGYELKIRADESPFTIGGDAGIDTAFLWVRKAPTASADPGIEVIAFN
ncbi:MAG: hypothetical protein R3324_12790 [Halobacteriales archaeon]|nr:hypothetical protein [Halobacteriales archaeon]